MEKPDLKGCKKEVIEYIEEVESKLERYKNNGAVEFVAALNIQLKKLAKDIESADISFEKSEDKLYDRFIKSATLGMGLVSDFDKFLVNYGDLIKKEDNKNNTIGEGYWKSRNGKVQGPE